MKKVKVKAVDSKKIKVLIAEPTSYANYLETNLKKLELFSITTTNNIPNTISNYDVIILNNLNQQFPTFQQQDIIKFVESGGGLFCIHDTLSPMHPYQEIVKTVGLQLAYDTLARQGDRIIQYLAKSDINDSLQRVPIEVVEENRLHPIVDDIDSFDIGEEFWAINTASDVKELLIAEIGDRIPATFRYREPIPICGCRSVKKGRTCFFLPLHYSETYQNQDVLNIFKNIIRWLGQVTSEGFDIFLSFSTRNKGEAHEIYEKAENKGLRIFMSEKDIESGDEWTETIRNALRSSREIAILVTPDSLNSKWVTIESGAAWSLKKRITPILFRCAPNQLPPILTNYEARDLHKLDLYLKEVIKRRTKNK